MTQLDSADVLIGIN